MQLFALFKNHKKDNLRQKVAVWVENHLGKEYVEEALDKYDKINSGASIGGFLETVTFLNMITQIKEEK